MVTRAATAFAAFLLAPALPASAGETAAPPQTRVEEPAEEDAESFELGVDRDRYERMTVPVTIAGNGPYRFFIDTGAQATVVTHGVTRDLGLEPTGRARLVAMGSSKIVETIDIDGLEFADRRVSGLTAPLLERTNIGADGILGLDSLQDLRVLLDFRADRITVADARTLGGNDGYEIVVRARRKLGQMIITDARLNGVRTAVIIDTGTHLSLGNLALLRKLRAKGSETLTATDVHGVAIERRLEVAKRLEIGQITLTGVPIGFADSPALAALGLEDRPALILGMGNLRMFERVAIDFASRRILFDLPGAGRDAARTARDLMGYPPPN